MYADSTEEQKGEFTAEVFKVIAFSHPAVPHFPAQRERGFRVSHQGEVVFSRRRRLSTPQHPDGRLEPRRSRIRSRVDDDQFPQSRRSTRRFRSGILGALEGDRGFARVPVRTAFAHSPPRLESGTSDSRSR